MEILKVTDKAFQPYGKVIQGIDVSDLLEALKETPQPDDVVYVASDEKLEACPCVEKIGYSLYGGNAHSGGILQWKQRTFECGRISQRFGGKCSPTAYDPDPGKGTGH